MGAIRWGILGTGRIAGEFATGLKSLRDAELVAVGSRASKTAEAFAERFDIPRRFSSYQALAEDPQVQVIYIATPHSLHCENALLCLDAGKAVLCEKPLALNAGEVDRMIKRARDKGLFLMEAMWTRFFPAMECLKNLLQKGAIGEPRQLMIDFGFRTDFKAEGRLFNLEQGGGSLLDVGVYPVSLSSMIFGPPQQVVGLANCGESGVDEQAAFVLKHSGGALALLSSAIRTETEKRLVLHGTEGRILVPPQFFQPTSLELTRADRAPEIKSFPMESNGYQYQATAVMSCLRSGKLECEVMPLDESRSIVETMDRLRAQWGLRYPNELKG